MNLLRLDDFGVLGTVDWHYNMTPNAVTLLNEFDLHKYITELSADVNAVVAEFHLIDDAGKHLAKNFAIPGEFEELSPVYDPKPELRIVSRNCVKGSQRISLEVKTQKPALFTSIVFSHDKIKKYRLSRNGFMQLQPIETVEATFNNPACLQTVDVNNFKIHSLNQFLPGYKSSSAAAFGFLCPFFLPIFAILNLM